MYSTVLGISANSNYRPKSRPKKSKPAAAPPAQPREPLQQLGESRLKKEKSSCDVIGTITPRSQNMHLLHSSPSQCSHSSDQNSLKSYREALKSKKSIGLSTDSMLSDSRPSHRRSVTHCLHSDHSGSTPTNQHFNRLLLSQNPQHSSYGDELKTERRIFTAETEQTPFDEESSAERSPPQPHKLKQCFSQLKVEEMSSPEEQDLSDLIPDFLQNREEKAEEEGLPLTSCFSYATLSHSSYKFKPAVCHPQKQEMQVLPTPGMQQKAELRRLEQMREQIAASKLVDRDRERAHYKLKKRAMNLSRSERPQQEAPRGQSGEGEEVTRRQSGPCFQKFVKNGADVTPRAMQSGGMSSSVSTPSPFHTCKASAHSGCSEFKFLPSGPQSRDVSPHQVRRSRLQTILESKKTQCEEVKDMVRYSVQSVARMLNENSSRISRSRSLSTNGIVPSSSNFDISEDQKNQTIPVAWEGELQSAGGRALSFVNIRQAPNGRYNSNEQPHSPYFKRARSQLRCRLEGTEGQHPLSLSAISQDELEGNTSQRARQKRDINKKSPVLVRCKTMIKERVQTRETWKREEPRLKVRHMFRAEKKGSPHKSPRSSQLMSRSSTPGLCGKKTGRAKMKPQMREAISKIETAMLARKSSGRAKTPCVRKQLKGEKETALVKRGVGNASKQPHSFGRQELHRRGEEQKQKSKKCSTPHKACSALQARKNFGKAVALRNYFLQTLKIPFRKFIRRLSNYEEILLFCQRRAARKIERAYRGYRARERIKRALRRYVRERRWKKRVLQEYRAFEPQMVQIQRWVRRIKSERERAVVHPLNIKRFKKRLGAVIKGWRVRKALRSVELQPLLKKVKETAQLMIDLRRDKSLTSRMFLRNVKRQHGPNVRQLIEAVGYAVRTRSWLGTKSLKKSGSMSGLQPKKAVGSGQKLTMAHQRELSKYGVRDRSLVNTRNLGVSRNSFQRAAVQRKSFKKKGLTLGKNMSELSSTMMMPSLKSPKSPTGSNMKRNAFIQQSGATPLTRSKGGVVSGRTPKMQAKQGRVEEKRRSTVKEAGRKEEKRLNSSMASGCSERREERDSEIIGQISSLFSAIKTQAADKAKAASEFNILMEQLQNQLHKHI